MKKKTIKNTTKKTIVCASRVSQSKATPKTINCSAKVTPIKATLESAITPEIEVKKPVCRHKDPRLPAPGTVFTKRFKGKDLVIEVTDVGLKWEGKTYKSLSGLAMAITEYPISGYSFFQKELLEWHQN